MVMMMIDDGGGGGGDVANDDIEQCSLKSTGRIIVQSLLVKCQKGKRMHKSEERRALAAYGGLISWTYTFRISNKDDKNYVTFLYFSLAENIC